MLTIGLSTSVEPIQGRSFARVGLDYISSILFAGGFPLIIPQVNNMCMLDQYIERMDVLLLTGGEDINPLLYREDNAGLSISISDHRDKQEMYLIEGALKKGCPIIGICRGLQLINAYFGGTLYQDLETQYHTEIKHQQCGEMSHLPTHSVKIAKGSKLEAILGCEELQVNSRHHQAIKQIAPGFQITAYSPDGVAEGIEGHDGKIVAVQWHPENLTKQCSINARLFQWMVQL